MLREGLDDQIAVALDEMDPEVASTVEKSISLLLNYTTDHVDQMVDDVTTDGLMDRGIQQEKFINVLKATTVLVLATFGFKTNPESTLRDLTALLEAVGNLPNKENFEDVLIYLDSFNILENNTELVSEILYDMMGLDTGLFFNTVDTVENLYLFSLLETANSATNPDSSVPETTRKRHAKIKEYVKNNPDSLLHDMIEIMVGSDTNPVYKLMLRFLNVGNNDEQVVKDIVGIYLVSEYTDPLEFWNNEIVKYFGDDPRAYVLKDEFIKVLPNDA